MTKKEEIGDQIKDSDYVLIHELIDWLKISERANGELQENAKEGTNMSWQILTTIARASKQIQSIMQRLNITPEKRSRAKKKEEKKQE